MSTAFNIVLVVGMIVSIMFSLLVFMTSKGDAMSGGSNVRTTYKGKAGFDDFVSKLVFILGCAFMGITLLLNFLAAQASK